MKIDDYSSRSLRGIFDKHISHDAKVLTDKWSGYKPLQKEFNIVDKYSYKGNSMKQFHNIVHQIKAWLRSVYS